MPDFEDEYTSALYMEPSVSNIDEYLNPVDSAIGGPRYVRVRKLMDAYKDVQSVYDHPAGTRVSLKGEDTDLMLSYPGTLPDPSSSGTIVTVKTAQGNLTAYDGRVFVKWDSGQFGSYLPNHLQVVEDGSPLTYKKAFSSFDLSDFMKTGKEGELVHLATNDLWSFEMSQDGTPVIVRLFDDTGSPIVER